LSIVNVVDPPALMEDSTGPVAPRDSYHLIHPIPPLVIFHC
jgi:hypothetical protein